jgi:uncharacterized membrane protein YgcG
MKQSTIQSINPSIIQWFFDEVMLAYQMNQAADLFCLRSMAKPVRDEIVASYVYGQRAGCCAPGIASKAVEARKQNASNLFIADAQDIPDSQQFDRRLCCDEMHPGLCFADDSAIYEHALRLTTSMERCLGQQYESQHMMIYDPGLPTSHVFFYLARKRHRSLAMQATHFLAVTFQRADRRLVFQRRARRLWDFKTLWTVAKECLGKKWRRVHIQVLNCRSEPDRSWTILARDLAKDHEVWPAMFRAAARPRMEGPPIDDPAPKRQARPPGVRVIGPSGNLRGRRIREARPTSDTGSGSEESGPGGSGGGGGGSAGLSFLLLKLLLLIFHWLRKR